MILADAASNRRSAPQACVVCGGSPAAAMKGTLLRCTRCRHLYALLSDTGPLVELYTESYFRGDEYFDYLGDERAIRLNFRARLAVLRKFLEPSRHRRLFEIGTAYGLFLQEAATCFESVQGVDVSAAAVRYATERLGLNVACADLAERDLGEAEFDVACMWDTIEHLERPDLYIQKVAEHMSAGSLIAITTGDIESLNARIRGAKWRLMHPPSHAHYFSRATLRRLLDRFGFDVIYDRHCGLYRSLKSMAYGVFVQGHAMSVPSDILERLGIGTWSVYLNLCDIMYLIGRKR